MSCRLLQGDALDVLETLEPQLANTDGVQLSASLPQRLTLCDVFIGEAPALDHANRPVLVREHSRTGNFGAVAPAIGLKLSKLKDGLRATSLDLQVWQEGLKCLRRLLVRQLPAVKRPAVVRVGLLTVVGSSETLGQKLYGWFINHAYLFATYPTALVKPCILAGTSERGVCPACGKPWERVTERGMTAHDGGTDSAYPTGTTANRLAQLRQAARRNGGEYANGTTTTGWRAGCDCDAGEPVPATVLDPFCGSGTTGLVALSYGRNFIGIDLSADYLALAEKRIAPAAAQGVLAL